MKTIISGRFVDTSRYDFKNDKGEDFSLCKIILLDEDEVRDDFKTKAYKVTKECFLSSGFDNKEFTSKIVSHNVILSGVSRSVYKKLKSLWIVEFLGTSITVEK